MAVSTAAFAFLSQLRGREHLTTLVCPSEASGPCLPKAPSLGTGPALLLPNLLTSGIRVDRKIRSTEHTHSRTGCPVGERAIARESQGNGQSSAQIDTIHELCHLFPIIGKRKNYSINHDEKMSCFGGKGSGAYLISNSKRSFRCLYC